MRVAAVGLTSGDDAVAARVQAVEAVRREARAGADLVVLPEYASRFDPRGVGREHAEALDGSFVTALREVAAETGTAVLAGTVVPAEERAVNLVVAIDPDGGVRGTYAKVHLYDAFGQRESDRLVAGDPATAPLVVDVGGLRVGVMTCYDLRFPESARRLVDAGATFLAVPAAWAAGPHKGDQWETLLRARAIESCAYVLGAARQGPGVAGDNLVVDPLGVVLARSAAAAVADVTAETVGLVRERNPSLENRRYGVVPRA